MEQFPEQLNVKNLDLFTSLLDEEHKRMMRKEIYIMILKRNETDFFDIDNFNRRYVKNMEKSTVMAKSICEELELLGWKTFFGFGGTGLYIYSTEDLPPGAY